MARHKNKTKTLSEKSQRLLARYCAVLVLVCVVVGYYFSATAYSDPFRANYSDINFTTQNWGMAFICFAAVFAYILKRLQGGIYWFFWLQLQATNPDERQQAVRRQVFERAYGIAIFFIFLVAPAAVIAISRYANPARDDMLSRASWIATIFFISLPSMLAAVRKDS